MEKKQLSFIFVLVFATSCTQTGSSTTQNPKDPGKGGLESLMWLCGHWTELKDNTAFHEIWTRSNDTVLSGYAYMLISADTVFTEKLSIEYHNPETCYITSVSNQNNRQEISFRLLPAGPDTFCFENKAHDFPQKITYIRRPENRLFVRVDGYDKGVYRKEEFQLKK